MNIFKYTIRKNVKNPDTNIFGGLEINRMNKHHKELINWGLQFVDFENVKSALDIGCGGGKCIKEISQKTAKDTKIYGIDISKESIKKSTIENKKDVENNRVSLLTGSAEKLPFIDIYFDLITAVETIYFWNLELSFKEIYKALNKNGKFVIINELKIKENAVELTKAFDVNVYQIDEIKTLATKIGFSDCKVIEKEDSEWFTLILTK